MFIPNLRTILYRTNTLRSPKIALLTRTGTRCLSDIPSYSFKIQDQEDFSERVLNSKVPVIVDFFATWCNPCKLLAPRIETIVDEKRGKVLLAKVDIDENSDIALEYNVKMVPVLQTFKNGTPSAQLVGLHDEDKIRAFVNTLIGE